MYFALTISITPYLTHDFSNLPRGLNGTPTARVSSDASIVPRTSRRGELVNACLRELELRVASGEVKRFRNWFAHVRTCLHPDPPYLPAIFGGSQNDPMRGSKWYEMIGNGMAWIASNRFLQESFLRRGSSSEPPHVEPERVAVAVELIPCAAFL